VPPNDPTEKRESRHHQLFWAKIPDISIIKAIAFGFLQTYYVTFRVHDFVS
jgi:hypothetical protein